MRKSLKSYVRQRRKNIKTRMKGRGSIKKWKERESSLKRFVRDVEGNNLATSNRFTVFFFKKKMLTTSLGSL